MGRDICIYMPTPTDPSPTGGAGNRRILLGEHDAVAAIDAVISHARHRLLVFDHELKLRGYNSPQRVAMLRSFLLASRQNQIRIALHETGGLQADCPRLVMLIRQFPAAIHVHRTLGVARGAENPLLIADDHSHWHRLHYLHPRSILLLNNVQDTQPLIERFDEIWDSSEAVSVGGTLGL